MAQIKVTHNKTARRFVVPETTTWADFERQLRSLFSIPSETTFAVSYTDEDGDVITLSSDLELRELLGQQRAGAGPIRLRVVTEEDSNEESWVAESVTDDAESLYPQGEESKESEENVTEDVIADVNTQQTDETDETAHLTREEQQQEERPRSYPSVTVVDEEDDPMFEPTSTYSSAEKGKQKEDAQKEDAQKEDDESEQRPPFLNLAQDFEVLLDRYHDIISRTPLLVDAANKVMDKILHGAKVDLDAMQAFFESFRRPTDGQGRADSTNAASSETQKDNDDDKDDDEDDDDNGYRRVYVYIRRPNNNLCFTPSFVRHPYWNNPFGNGIFHFYGPRYVNPSFVSPRFVNPFSTPVFGPRIAARPCGMRSAAACCPCPNAGYRMRFACAPSSFRTCAPSSNTCANRCARTCQRSGGQQASDAYADKIKQLESMGFTNRAEVEDLLRRYNGRMSRVVEILVRQRNGSHQTSSTTTRKIPIVDASAASSPSSSSDVTDVTATPVTDSAKEERVSFAKDVSNSNSDVVQKDETSKFSQSAATLVNVDANGQVLPYSL